MENIDIYAKCPHCNVELDYQKELSVEFDDAYYFVNWSAFCPQCQRTYTFVEDYRLVERQFLNEENPIQMRLVTPNRAGPMFYLVKNFTK